MSEELTQSPEPEASSHDAVVIDGKAQDLSKPSSEKDANEPEQKADDNALANEQDQPDADPSDRPDDEQKPKQKPNRFQDRINDLTRQRHEAERRAADAERRAQEAERRLWERQNQPPADDDFEAQENRRLADFFDQREMDEAQRAVQAAQIERHNTRVHSFQTRVAATLGDQAQQFLGQFNSIPVSETAADVITDSEVGVEMAMYLTQNPMEASRLANLPPIHQARELTRLEARIQSAPKVRRQTQAPPPPRTIESKATNAAKDPANMSDAEYSEWYRQRQKSR